MRVLPAAVVLLLVAAGCMAPQIGYRDPRISNVQLVSAEVAQSKALPAESLHVDVIAANDPDAVAAFLRAAAARRASLASDLALVIEGCVQPLAPVSHQETHEEQVSHEVSETTEVPEQRCDRVMVSVDDGYEWRDDCSTVMVTQTTSHTEWTTEQVTETIWTLSRSPAMCPPGGSILSVEGTIYGASAEKSEAP